MYVSFSRGVVSRLHIVGFSKMRLCEVWFPGMWIFLSFFQFHMKTCKCYYYRSECNALYDFYVCIVQ